MDADRELSVDELARYDEAIRRLVQAIEESDVCRPEVLEKARSLLQLLQRLMDEQAEKSLAA